MMPPKIAVRMRATGEVRQFTPRDAKLMVAARKADYLDADVAGTYATKDLVTAPKRRGRPPKNKDEA